MKRIPRPLGHTQLAHYLNNTSDTKQRDMIINKIISYYTEKGFINEEGKQIPLPELAQYLNISTFELMRRITRTMNILGNMMGDKEAIRGIASAIFSQALNLGLQGTQIALNQVHILRQRQGNKFVPFLTKELNGAIANLTNANKPLIELFKALTDKPETNIIFNTNQSVTNQNVYLTPDEALKIIDTKQKSILTDLSLLDDTLSSLPELPEVDARKQELTSDDVRKLGTKMASEKQDKNSPKITHESRREAEFGTILGAEDFMA